MRKSSVLLFLVFINFFLLDRFLIYCWALQTSPSVVFFHSSSSQNTSNGQMFLRQGGLWHLDIWRRQRVRLLQKTGATQAGKNYVPGIKHGSPSKLEPIRISALSSTRLLILRKHLVTFEKRAISAAAAQCFAGSC